MPLIVGGLWAGALSGLLFGLPTLALVLLGIPASHGSEVPGTLSTVCAEAVDITMNKALTSPTPNRCKSILRDEV